MQVIKFLEKVIPVIKEDCGVILERISQTLTHHTVIQKAILEVNCFKCLPK